MALSFDYVVTALGREPREAYVIDAAQIAWCPARYIVGVIFEESPLFSVILGLLKDAGYEINKDECVQYTQYRICGRVHAIAVLPKYVDAYIVVNSKDELIDYMNYASVIAWILRKKYGAQAKVKLLIQEGSALIVWGNPPTVPDELVTRHGLIVTVPIDIPEMNDQAIDQFIRYYTAYKEYAVLPIHKGNYCATCPLRTSCIEKLVPPNSTKQVTTTNAPITMQPSKEVDSIDGVNINEIKDAVRRQGEVVLKLKDESWDKIGELDKKLRSEGLMIMYKITTGQLVITRAKREKRQAQQEQKVTT